MQLTQEQFDHGKRALARFRQMISTRYAPLLRAVTKNDRLNVEPHGQMSFTDGKSVWLMTPWELGDETLEHDKATCGLRDADLYMVCPACRVLDHVDSTVYHESAHITEDSFGKVRGAEVVKMVETVFATELATMEDSKRADLLYKVGKADNAVVATRSIDFHLGFIHNCVEDIYVNRRLIESRPGVMIPLRNHVRETFQKGWVLADGTSVSWKDQEVDQQAGIATYLMGSGNADLRIHLAPEVGVVFDDDKIQECWDSLPGDCDPLVRLEISSKMLVRLRELGFLAPYPDTDLPLGPAPSGDPSGDPSPGQGQSGSSQADPNGDDDSDDPSGGGDDSSDEEGDGEAAPSGGSGSSEEEDGEAAGSGEGEDQSSDSDESGEEDGDDTEDGPYGPGSGQTSDSEPGDSSLGSDSDDEASSTSDDKDDEPLDPQDLEEQRRKAEEMLTYLMGHEPPDSDGQGDQENPLERVLVQEGFDRPTDFLKGGYDLVDKSRMYDLDGAQPVKAPPGIIAPSLAQLRVVFAENKKSKLERNLRSGQRLDTLHLYRAGMEDYRIFGNKNRPKDRDWFVLVGLDFSGSTGANGADYAIKMAGHALGELLHLLGIRFAMYSHSSGHTNGTETLEHREIKSPKENWRDRRVQGALFSQQGTGVNLDGHTMEQYRKIIEAERAERKLLLYFTDGEMPCFNYDEELEILQEELRKLQRLGIDTLGVGYRTDSPKRHGLDTIQFDRPDDVRSIVKGLESRLRS